MRVLFVSSGNSGDLTVVVRQQALSLIQEGHQIDFFLIKGKGIIGYLKNILAINRAFKEKKYDIVHAHYSFSAFAATLAACKPLIVSLMGSDGQNSGWQKFLIRYYSKKRWDKTIAKSVELVEKTGIKNYIVIPNGVDIQIFAPISQGEARRKLGLIENQFLVLFAANPNRFEKNFALAKSAISSLNGKNIELVAMVNFPHETVALWMNAADVVLLTSVWEGSPNVIKEAMACNRPIVATEVGDIKWLFGDEPGHYLASFDSHDVAGKIINAIDYSKKYQSTNGRQRIKSLNLDSISVAKKIISIYKKTINEDSL